MRLFFALWPQSAMRIALHRIASAQKNSCGGRVMREDSIHLTLLFLGETPQARLPQLIEAASSIQLPQFDLRLDSVRGWRHNAIIYAAPSNVPELLLELVDQLRTHVEEAGFIFDKKAFVPHVTLLRKVERLQYQPSILPLHWAVEEFVLVHSIPTDKGMQYQIIGRWPLEQV